MNSYKLISINVNSLISNKKKLSLMHFIENNKPDFLCLSKTKLKTNNKLSIDNYILIRRDKTCGINGGFVELKHNKKLFIISIYGATASRNSNKFIEELGEIFSILDLSNPNNFYILAGDFNAKYVNWQYGYNDARGIQLNKFLKDKSLLYKLKLYKTDGPTLTQANSYIDLVISDMRIKSLFYNTHDKLKTLPYDGDHNAMQFSFLVPNNKLELKELPEVYKFRYNNVNWEKFKKVLDKNFDEDFR